MSSKNLRFVRFSIVLIPVNCLNTGDSTTPLLSAQRVSPLRLLEIFKQVTLGVCMDSVAFGWIPLGSRRNCNFPFITLSNG